MVFEYILKENGIDPEKDLTIIQNIDFGSTAPAFADGRGDFTIEFEPGATSLESEGKGHVIASLGKDSGYVPYTAFSAKKSYLKENTDLARQCFRDLSGGQQQRALLARALCATKSLLLLDEPVTGLDPIVTGEFYDLIRKINQESNIAVVMVSHDIETAVENASHILHLQETVRFFGTAEDYRKSRIGKKFLGGEEHD